MGKITRTSMGLARIRQKAYKTALLLTLVLTTIPLLDSSLHAGEAEPVASSHDLRQFDGLKFSARIVREDGGDGDQISDKLTFNDGMFSSEICKRYNFVDAPYWVRKQDERLYFLAELKSPTDGTMIWKGTIEGDTIEGTMRWTKKRWYWTIDTEHRIRGKLEKAESGTTPE